MYMNRWRVKVMARRRVRVADDSGLTTTVPVWESYANQNCLLNVVGIWNQAYDVIALLWKPISMNMDCIEVLFLAHKCLALVCVACVVFWFVLLCRGGGPLDTSNICAYPIWDMANLAGCMPSISQNWFLNECAAEDQTQKPNPRMVNALYQTSRFIAPADIILV